jgi:hypothetical protein
LAAANYTLAGFIGNDNVALNNPTIGVYASKDVGNNIGVSVSGLALTGAAAGNYVLASTAANGNIGVITPATLTAALTGTVSKIYDGTTVATLAPANYTLSGIIGNDNVTLNEPAAGVYASKDVGNNIGVGVSGLALTGATAGDYVLASTTASANIGMITPATLTVGLTGTVSKGFDRTTLAILSPANYTLAGVVAGDLVLLNDPILGLYAPVGVGSGILVTVTGLAISGPSAADYILASTTVSAPVGVITVGAPPLIPVQPQPVSEKEMPIIQPYFGQPDQPLLSDNGNQP